MNDHEHDWWITPTGAYQCPCGASRRPTETVLHPSHDWTDPTRTPIFCDRCDICTCHSTERATQPCRGTADLPADVVADVWANGPHPITVSPVTGSTDGQSSIAQSPTDVPNGAPE